MNLYTTRIGLRQPEPPEGRAMFPLGAGDGGGDGMHFVTGAEIFQFNTNQIPGAQRPSGILGMWVDATNLTAGKNLTITIGNQTFIFAGGNQGYVPITTQLPFTMSISTNGGTGTVSVILYNYNPLFTGSVTTAPTIAVGSSAGSGSGGSGGGSRFGDTGGSGGGRPTF